MSPSSTKKSDLQLVPETILKKRHDLDELKARRAATLGQQNNRKVFSASQKSLLLSVKKPHTFLARAKSRRHHDIRLKRVMKKGMQKRASNKVVMKTKVIQDEEETITLRFAANSVGVPMVFVMRIRDNVGIPKSVKRILNNFRLKYVHQGVFLRYNDNTRKCLHMVEPWVVYGMPSRAVIQDLIARRGHGQVKGKEKERVPLSDNTIVEKALGDEGVICVEDMVHELHTAGSNFDRVALFLCPFSLSPPKTRFETDKLNDKMGNVYGDQGQCGMDEQIKQML